MLSCEQCTHCATVDEGYSNYTVEGTSFHCIVGAHPDAPFDRWYGEEGRLNYAERCPRFEEGPRLDVDVDREDGEIHTQEQADWYLAQQGGVTSSWDGIWLRWRQSQIFDVESVVVADVHELEPPKEG